MPWDDACTLMEKSLYTAWTWWWWWWLVGLFSGRLYWPTEMALWKEKASQSGAHVTGHVVVEWVLLIGNLSAAVLSLCGRQSTPTSTDKLPVSVNENKNPLLQLTAECACHCLVSHWWCVFAWPENGVLWIGASCGCPLAPPFRLITSLAALAIRLTIKRQRKERKKRGKI